MVRFNQIWQQNLKQKLSSLAKSFWGNLDALATFLVGLASLLIAFNQYRAGTELQRVQNELSRTEVSFVEGQLVASLMTSLIQGSESEREMARLILVLKAPEMAERILPIISQNDPSPRIRKNAEEQLRNVQFTKLLRNANIFLQIGRYRSAAEYFYQAAALVDSSKVNLQLLEVATSRYNAHSDSLAAKLFQQALSNFQKNK